MKANRRGFFGICGVGALASFLGVKPRPQVCPTAGWVAPNRDLHTYSLFTVGTPKGSSCRVLNRDTGQVRFIVGPNIQSLAYNEEPTGWVKSS